MNATLQKIAAVLALVIRSMALLSGGQVLLGKEMDYYVIDWLPVYNFLIGAISVLITARLIWQNNRYAPLAAILTTFAHAGVMLVLQIGYRQVVAPDSLVAMTLRISTWAVILTLMYFQSRKNRLRTA